MLSLQWKGRAMKIISGWKRALTSFSAIALSASAIIPTIWLNVPEEAKAIIPPEYLATISAVVATVGWIGRFVDQRKPEERVADELIQEVKNVAKYKGIEVVRDAVRKVDE